MLGPVGLASAASDRGGPGSQCRVSGCSGQAPLL